MKTPREILLEKHRTAASKLDTIRERTLARLAEPPKRKWSGEESSFSLRDVIFSLRWHLAGMGTVWLIVALLNLNAGHSPGLMAAVPRGKIPSAQIIMASLRENRRELLQMIQSPDAHDAGPQRLIPPQPRSQRRYENLTA
jgi:hypothetical protein